MRPPLDPFRERSAHCALVIAVAFVVRGIHLLAVANTPFFDGFVVDARAYARDAEILLADGFIDFGFYRPPLYVYLQAGLALLGLDTSWFLGIAHALAGAVTAEYYCTPA
jgi:hypothetical protein